MFSLQLLYYTAQKNILKWWNQLSVSVSDVLSAIIIYVFLENNISHNAQVNI